MLNLYFESVHIKTRERI